MIESAVATLLTHGLFKDACLVGHNISLSEGFLDKLELLLENRKMDVITDPDFLIGVNHEPY